MKKVATIFLLSVLSIVAHSQELPTKVNEEYKLWRSKLTSTKTFLVLSQDKYAPGDTIFFSAFFVTEDGFFVSGYQILRIALVDSNGQTIHRQLVSLNNGIGGNQFILPSSMREGNYMIIAYNDYMKAYSQSFYFRREISVVKKNSIQSDLASMVPVVAAEGGHLVQGIANRVVIVVPDNVTRSITITTTQGREVATATLDEFGTGSVVFTPQKGDKYLAIANRSRTPLPAAEDDGCSLQLVSPLADTSVVASIALPATSRWRNSELVAALTVNGSLYYTAGFKQGTRKAITVKFPKKDLLGGLALLSIITEDGSVLASRHFYIQSAPLRCDIQVITNNENVTSEISITDPNGKPLESVFTMTATNESLFDQAGPAFPPDINIVSEVGALYSRSTALGWPGAVDNYLVTQPGNISWPAIMSKIEPAVKAPPKSVTVSGQAYFSDTNQPIPDSSLVAGYMMNNRFAFEFKSGMNGSIDIGFLALDGRDEMFYFIESEGKELEKVKIRWVFDSLAFRASPWKPSSEPDKYASFTTTRNAIDRSFNAFGSSKPVGTTTTYDSRLEDDLSNTGTTINVQEYRVFSDMPDLIREIIPRLYYRKNGRREIVRVVFSDAYLQPVSSPLYIIDGMLTRSNSVFLALSPADIITLKVIYDPAELSRFQAIAKNGIVIVKTNKGTGAKGAERYSTIIEGTNNVIPFRVPAGRTRGTRRKPEFRSTVYWNPEVRTGKNGKATVSFFVTDDIGKIKIRIRGLAAGQYFEAEKVVEVSAFK